MSGNGSENDPPDPTEEPEYSPEPDQTHPKTRNGDDERDDDAEDRAASDDDASEARSEVADMSQQVGLEESVDGEDGETESDGLSEDTGASDGQTNDEPQDATDGSESAADNAGAVAGGGESPGDGGVGPTDSAETVDTPAYADALTPGAEDSPLSRGATDPHYRDDDAPLRSAPVEHPSNPNRVGGWEGFSDEQVESTSSMLEAGAQGGGTQQNMEVLSLSDDADAERAFASYYGEDANDWEKAHSQMATYALADAVGLRYPDHTFDAEQQRVVVAEVGDENREQATLWELSDDEADAPPEWADEIDRDELLSHYAVHLLAGNNDLHGGNIIVDEAGTVHTFDGDKAQVTYESSDEMKEKMGATGDSIHHLERNRTDPINISQDDIVEEAREIAIDLQESGQKEAVLDHISQYDDEFANRSGRVYRDRVEQNMDALIYDIPGI